MENAGGLENNQTKKKTGGKIRGHEAGSNSIHAFPQI